MPTYEGICRNDACGEHGRIYEYLLRKWTDPDPACPHCSSPVERQLAAPAVVWAAGMERYGGEHVATTRDEKGNVVKHRITTRQEQKEFCRRYGYYDPTEIPSSPTADREGRLRNTQGEKGSWI